MGEGLLESSYDSNPVFITVSIKFRKKEMVKKKVSSSDSVSS